MEELAVVDAKKELFDKFYKDHQSDRELANNGSIELRTKWNKIMTYIPEVIYKIDDSGKSIVEKNFTPYNESNPDAGSNEIKAVVINLYNVLAYLLQKEQLSKGQKNDKGNNNDAA